MPHLSPVRRRLRHHRARQQRPGEQDRRQPAAPAEPRQDCARGPGRPAGALQPGSAAQRRDAGQARQPQVHGHRSGRRRWHKVADRREGRQARRRRLLQQPDRPTAWLPWRRRSWRRWARRRRSSTTSLGAFGGRGTLARAHRARCSAAEPDAAVLRPGRQRRGLLLRRQPGRDLAFAGGVWPGLRRDARRRAGQARLPGAVRAAHVGHGRGCRRVGARSSPAPKAWWPWPWARSWWRRASAQAKDSPLRALVRRSRMWTAIAAVSGVGGGAADKLARHLRQIRPAHRHPRRRGGRPHQRRAGHRGHSGAQRAGRPSAPEASALCAHAAAARSGLRPAPSR